MFTRTCLAFVLLLACSDVWSQVEANGTGQVDTNGTEEATSSLDEVQMSTPPPVSGANYSAAFASETQQSSNVRAGLTISTVHSNNVVGGDTLNPVSDVSYSIWPTLALDATTTRLHSVLTYSPGFTFYQRMSSLNQSDQNVALDLSYRLSPNLTLSFRSEERRVGK